VNEVLREIIAGELERHSDEDPRLEFVTITGVDADSDFRQAKVFISALGTSASPNQVIEALEERRIRLQSVVGKNVRLKHTPQLAFFIDPAILEGQKVEGILQSLREDEGQGAKDAGPEAG
jgi:ribosome-binding factor A